MESWVGSPVAFLLSVFCLLRNRVFASWYMDVLGGWSFLLPDFARIFKGDNSFEYLFSDQFVGKIKLIVVFFYLVDFKPCTLVMCLDNIL